jgi:hypothetical protein
VARPDRAVWDRLTARLDRAADDGRRIAFWWRDDDAVRPTPALDRLLSLAARADVPLGLAVIPASAEPALVRRLAVVPRVTVLVHGWQHANHAAGDARQAELGDDRPAAVIAAELAGARRRLATLFGAQALPVLVPPWNRMGAGALAGLAEAGFSGISRLGPEGLDDPAGGGRVPPGLAEANVHVDPVAWRDGHRFVGVDALADQLLKAIDAPGRGARPVGLMTHHWAHDEATWAALETLAGLLAGHPGAVWADPRALFRPAEATP